MPVKLEPASVIIANLGLDPTGPVQTFFTSTCYNHMDKYVPRRSGSDGGSLREIVTFQPNSITYEMPYASYQYYGMRKDGTHKVNPDNYSTPGTGAYWDKRMVSAEIQDVVAEVQNYFNRGGR